MNRIETSEEMVLGGSAAIPKTGIVAGEALVMMETIDPKMKDSSELPSHEELQC